MTNSFSDHLEQYGIFAFDSDEYWTWGGERLGAKRARTVDQLRKPINRGHPTKRQLLAFYDYIADLEIGAVVHSLKAGAITASGEAIATRIEGRKRVLDVGCAIGYTTTWLAAIDPGRLVTGIDFSLPAVQTATECAKRLGIENVKFVHADLAEALPEGPYDFDPA